MIVEGLADELGGEIYVLFAAALAVMALVLIAVFGPPLRLLPLLVAIGAAGFAFGLLSLLGGTLTMASVAVLPVVIGLGVDYAIQLQARFREAAASGERPPAAAVIAAVRGGPVIGTAALATSVGFLGARALADPDGPRVRDRAGRGDLRRAGDLADRRARRALDDRAAPSRTAADGLIASAGRSLGDASRRSAEVVASAKARLSSPRPSRARDLDRQARARAARRRRRWRPAAGRRDRDQGRQRHPRARPGDLPALQGVDELQDATGVSGELDVLVCGDVTSPEAIAWMSDFKARVLERARLLAEYPGCRAEGTELCPGPALSDLFDLGTTARIPPATAAPDGPHRGRARRGSAVLLAGDPLAGSSGEERRRQHLLPDPGHAARRAAGADRLDPRRARPAGGDQAEVVGLPVLAADANSELSGSRYWLTLAGLLAVGLVLLAVYRSASRALVPLLPIALATGWSSLVLEAVTSRSTRCRRRSARS